MHQLAAHVQLLYLVAPDGAYYAAGLPTLSEAIARHSEIISVRRRQAVDDVLFHADSLLFCRTDVVSVGFHSVDGVYEIRKPRKAVAAVIESLKTLLELYSKRTDAVASVAAREFVDEPSRRRSCGTR